MAVSLVVVAHTVPGMILLGGVGVVIFFVLSAYLITAILLEQRASVARGESTVARSLRVFYARRAFRIFPAYYLLIVVLIVTHMPTVREDWAWHALYLSNWRVALGGAWIRGVTHLWTLSVEEQFYLTWPLLVLLLPARRFVPVCVGMIALAAASRYGLALITRDAPHIITPTFANLDALAIGALLAWHRHNWPEESARRRETLTKVLFAGAVILLAGFALQVARRDPATVMASSQLGWAMFSVWTVDQCIEGTLARWLERPLFVGLGSISYGVYLWHEPIHRWLVGETAPAGVGSVGPLPPVVTILPVASLSVVAALISWRLVERPVNRLKRHFPYSATRDPETTTARYPDTGQRAAK